MKTPFFPYGSMPAAFVEAVNRLAELKGPAYASSAAMAATYSHHSMVVEHMGEAVKLVAEVAAPQSVGMFSSFLKVVQSGLSAPVRYTKYVALGVDTSKVPEKSPDEAAFEKDTLELSILLCDDKMRAELDAVDKMVSLVRSKYTKSGGVPDVSSLLAKIFSGKGVNN